jgi:hypothetical protein
MARRAGEVPVSPTTMGRRCSQWPGKREENQGEPPRVMRNTARSLVGATLGRSRTGEGSRVGPAALSALRRVVTRGQNKAGARRAGRGNTLKVVRRKERARGSSATLPNSPSRDGASEAHGGTGGCKWVEKCDAPAGCRAGAVPVGSHPPAGGVRSPMGKGGGGEKRGGEDKGRLIKPPTPVQGSCNLQSELCRGYSHDKAVGTLET